MLFNVITVSDKKMLYLRYYHYDDLISVTHKCLIIILATLIFHDVNFFCPDQSCYISKEWY